MDPTLVLILIQFSALCHGYTIDYDYDQTLTNIAEHLPRDLEHDVPTQNKRVLKVVPFTESRKWKKKLVPMPPEIHEYKDIPIAVIVAATEGIPDEDTDIEDFNQNKAEHANHKTYNEESLEIDDDEAKVFNTNEVKVKVSKDLKSKAETKTDDQTKVVNADEVKSDKHNASEGLDHFVEKKRVKTLKSKGETKSDEDKSKAGVSNTDEVKVKIENKKMKSKGETKGDDDQLKVVDGDTDEVKSHNHNARQPLKSNDNENNLDVTDDDTKIADDNDVEGDKNDDANEVNVGDNKDKSVHYFDDFKVEIQREEPVDEIRSVIPKPKDDDAQKTYNLWFIFKK